MTHLPPPPPSPAPPTAAAGPPSPGPASAPAAHLQSRLERREEHGEAEQGLEVALKENLLGQTEGVSVFPHVLRMEKENAGSLLYF